MKPAYFDSGIRFDDPNFYWGNPSYLLEPGDPGYVAAPPISSPTITTRKPSKTMTADYVPQSYPNLDEWCAKQAAELDATLGTAIGMTDPERAAFLAAVATVKTAVAPIVDLMQQLDELTANFPMILDAQLPLIRVAIKRAKTSPGCTPAIQTQLDWIARRKTWTPPIPARPLMPKPSEAASKSPARSPASTP